MKAPYSKIHNEISSTKAGRRKINAAMDKVHRDNVSVTFTHNGGEYTVQRAKLKR